MFTFDALLTLTETVSEPQNLPSKRCQGFPSETTFALLPIRQGPSALQIREQDLLLCAF